MRIVVDMQGAQAENRKRGIGRYTLSFVEAVVRQRGEHEVILVLSGLLADSIVPIRSAFAALLPQENIRVWDAPGPVQESVPGNDARREAAEALREAFIAQLQPDVVHLTSFFEGYADEGVTSIAAFDANTPISVTLYDLIPLLHREHYLDNNPAFARCYERKLAALPQAALVLAISESSRREAIAHLGFSEENAINAGTAVDAHFQPHPVAEAERAQLASAYGLRRPFLMYTGGLDYRKNIEGLIRAYATLAPAIRDAHQLAIVCAVTESERTRLEAEAAAAGLPPGGLVLTGFVSESDLLLLYNACTAFVFPSLHEGFGLPALEAMSCGKAVIASNSSSLPEVVGLDEALFDPRDGAAMTAKIAQVLGDADFRVRLERHCLHQAGEFSWKRSAQRALGAWEKLHAARSARNNSAAARKPRLAYVSPLPPERSGISYYSAELLPYLAKHYEIDVIATVDPISDPAIAEHCTIRSTAWFAEHAAEFDRILYHFGNSGFHDHMFGLLQDAPGVVVLHDFFLSGIVAHRELNGSMPGSWTRELYHAHGYPAIAQRYLAQDDASVIWAYPCNLSVLQQALGVITHSPSSLTMCRHWYGNDAALGSRLIPLLRVPPAATDRAAARRELGLSDEDVVVCSFGMIGANKHNRRLLDAWLASALAADARCTLVFVGENQGDAYGTELAEAIAQSAHPSRIRITGWADDAMFRAYLAAADIGVQLRCLSRGETSSAVLDCMIAGLPTIVNAHGSMADLPNHAVNKLPDEFTIAELVQALEALREDAQERAALGERARHHVELEHAPVHCALLYRDAIEDFYRRQASSLGPLTKQITAGLPATTSDAALLGLSRAMAQALPPRPALPQLLVDISELVKVDARSGIQRVVRSILSAWLADPPAGFRVEPVYATEHGAYRYARRYTLGFLGCPVDALHDEVIEVNPGDRFIGLDLQPQVVYAHGAFYQALRRQGVRVQFVIYDLLPLLLPHAFIDGATNLHRVWLQTVVQCDGALCISRSVALELAAWMKNHAPDRLPHFDIDWFHLGADVAASRPTAGLPMSSIGVLNTLRESHAFLMIGTLEPRKGHAQVLAAFEQLWAQEADVRLVIVGKAGWMVDDLVRALKGHRELGKRLFWLDGISDEYLEELYGAATCLIAASHGEGFGLPLIEASQHGLPVLARDIPVFREVAGNAAAYFSGNRPEELAAAVSAWLQGFVEGTAPQSAGIPRLSWAHSAAELARLAVRERKRPRLAFVAPLPPERTGVANYCGELLPALAPYYDIVLVSDQEQLLLPAAIAHLPHRSTDWFEANGATFDRVLYQVGNSPFHARMPGLMRKHPGLVMLHDFFLSGLYYYCELARVAPDMWSHALYRSHGYRALQDRFAPDAANGDGTAFARYTYPSNIDVLHDAKGIIVHSDYSMQLARQWYGTRAAQGWYRIPHLRKTPPHEDRAAARAALGIAPDTFVVCSFGFIAPTKLSDRLLNAWLASTLAADPACLLVFAGSDDGDYGARLAARIAASPARERIRIAGWIDTAVYDQYLQAADVGVQLRTLSRGETSGAVLDCLNYGLPTVINAHGSMQDVPKHAVWQLPDQFDDGELIEALQSLHGDAASRTRLGSAARELIRYTHDPNLCAAQYAAALESCYRDEAHDTYDALAPRILNLPPAPRDAVPAPGKGLHQPQLLLDVSEIARNDLHAGIERVTRAQVSALLRDGPPGYRVEPVYLHEENGIAHYRYARRFTHSLLGIEVPVDEEKSVAVAAGDVFYGADFCPGYVVRAAQAGIYSHWRQAGVRIAFQVYDLLPVLRPEFFPPGAADGHATWLAAVGEHADDLICISQAVASDLARWLEEGRAGALTRLPCIGAAHIGADIAASKPSQGLPHNADALLATIAATPSFLMVGTIEPRKGHLQTIRAFDALWAAGENVNLVIVGREGWNTLDAALRRTLPETIAALRQHPEFGKRLIWIEGASDEFLQRLYAAARCLIVASEGEGFGLPLIEAARLGLPIIVRDIPVFRELADGHAWFFDGTAPADLAHAIASWRKLDAAGQAPSSKGIAWTTWAQNAAQIRAILFDQPGTSENITGSASTTSATSAISTTSNTAARSSQ